MRCSGAMSRGSMGDNTVEEGRPVDHKGRPLQGRPLHGGGGGSEEVAACLRAHERFVMCAHEKPDGDVLGSGYALGLALKSLGKHVTYFLDDEVPKNLRFLPECGYSQRTFDGVADDAIFIFFDMSDQSRAGAALQWVPK